MTDKYADCTDFAAAGRAAEQVLAGRHESPSDLHGGPVQMAGEHICEGVCNILGYSSVGVSVVFCV